MLEYSDMFHERGECHIEGFCEFADAGRPPAQPLEHRPACGVGQCVEDAVELVGILSHKEKYQQRNS